jgi:hypothetical protein
VTVTSSPGLEACLVVTPTGPLTAQGDAGCSTGNIVEYRWWNNWLDSPNQVPDATTATPLRALLYEVSGTYTVRLEVVDASGATSATTRVLTLF